MWIDSLIAGTAVVLAAGVPSFFIRRNGQHAQEAATCAAKAVVELEGNGKGSQTEMLERIETKVDTIEDSQQTLVRQHLKILDRMMSMEDHQLAETAHRAALAQAIAALQDKAS